MNDRLYIIIPAYNEEENIRQLILDWYPIIKKHNKDGKSLLVVVNDGSKDNTYEILQSLAKSRPQLLALTKNNGGHGSALLYGYHYAIEHGADWIFQTDSDRQTNPNEFDAFWELREKFDAVIGTRQKSRQDGRSRVFVENVLRMILKIIFGVSVPDANAPFRLMKTELVSKYIEKIPGDFNLPNVMLTTYFALFHEKIEYIEISFKPREKGKNTINVRKIIGIGWKAIGDFYQLKRHM